MQSSHFLNLDNLKTALLTFSTAKPYNYCVIDSFLDNEVALKVHNEFLDHESDKWHVYSNAIEEKKALNDWNVFPQTTYSLFRYLNSSEFLEIFSQYAGLKLISDPGLHGGGWHSHCGGGRLNPHLDYSIHPKLKLERVINIIIYMNPEYTPSYGGHLGLWDHNKSTNQPGSLVKEIEPRFNRAIIFNTTQNSWHGISRPLSDPFFVRRSLAVYYLQTPSEDASPRERALFAPTIDQLGDSDVEELIRLRSDVNTSFKVYKK